MKKKSKTACCDWDSFVSDFRGYLDHEPSEEEMEEAEKNWRARSTGWEAAQIAMQPPDPDYKLKHLGGKHYQIIGT